MEALYAFLISRVLATSDNIFERIYIITIYRANSPPPPHTHAIYARVNVLDFVAHIVKQGCWWSFLYILNHEKQDARTQCMKGKCLRTKPSIQTNFL
jgi:hypothetical protein